MCRIVRPLPLLVLVFLIGCEKPATEGGRAPADMSYKELLEHLRKSGLTIYMHPAGSSQVYVNSDEEGDARIAARRVDDREPTGPRAVVVNKHQSEKAAKEYAERSEKGTFHWGKFSFHGSEEENSALNKFRKALGR